MKRVSRGPNTKNRREDQRNVQSLEAGCLIGGKRTVVDSSTDETGEGECCIEDAVGGVRQSDVLNTTSPQVGYSREHPDGGEAKIDGNGSTVA